MQEVETGQHSTRRGTFDRAAGEYNMPPCHGGDQGFKSPRGRHPRRGIGQKSEKNRAKVAPPKDGQSAVFGARAGHSNLTPKSE